MTRNELLKGLPPVHPGELLREVVVPATGKTKAEIASLLGISRQHLYDIIEEKKPVTTAMALRLGKLFGNGAELWADMQRAYDVEVMGREMADELKRIPTLKVA